MACLSCVLAQDGNSAGLPDAAPAEAGTAEAAIPVLALDSGLQQLAAEFFAWRRSQQPASRNPLARVERPAGWIPRVAAEDLAICRVQYRDFLGRLEGLDRSAFSRADDVDALALAAAIKRVGWELDVLRLPQRNPQFYIDQTLGTVFELLVLSSPLTPQRIDELTLRLLAFAGTLDHARTHLTAMALPFAVAAVENLLEAEPQLQAVYQGLLPSLTETQATELGAAIESASAALANYRLWLQRQLPDLDPDFAIGPDAFEWYLWNIALVPRTANELLLHGRQAWSRAVAFDTLEKNQNRELPELPLFPSAEVQIEASFQNEREIRAFLDHQGVLSMPAGLPHYRLRALPDYLAPLRHLGDTIDLGSESRPGHDAVRYVTEPGEDLPYLQHIAARDPRPRLIHEGVVPGAPTTATSPIRASAAPYCAPAVAGAARDPVEVHLISAPRRKT